MNKVAERLHLNVANDYDISDEMILDAADEIERLETENARLLATLKLANGKLNGFLTADREVHEAKVAIRAAVIEVINK